VTASAGPSAQRDWTRITAQVSAFETALRLELWDLSRPT
jgi:hypothetical protein